MFNVGSVIKACDSKSAAKAYERGFCGIYPCERKNNFAKGFGERLCE